MANFAVERFPQFKEQILRLTEQHREFRDEPLHLAIAYDPGRGTEDIFLFEVIGHFGGDLSDPDQDLFELAVEPSPAFPMKPGQLLYLVLTNPGECREAIRDNWTGMQELRAAVRRGDFEVLYSDNDIGAELLEEIKNE